MSDKDLKEKMEQARRRREKEKKSTPARPTAKKRTVGSGAAMARRPARPQARPARPRATPVETVSEETRAKLDALQDQLGDLHESLLMTAIYNEMEEVETSLSLLPSRIEELRTKGYVFRSFLEKKVGVLAEQWEEAYDRVLREVKQRQRELERESDTAESALRQAMSGRASQVSRAESAINTLASKVDAAQSAARAMYDTLQGNVSQTRYQVKQIDWLLDQIDEATFQLHPAEDPVMACEVQYMETKKEGPKGVLYLTDERLLFEQKEEIATKKVLFITTEKEKVQELIFEVLVGQIDEVKTSEKGFLGHKEMMELLFAPEADLSDATLRLHGDDNEEWARTIGRIKSGEIDKERTQPKDEAIAAAARR